MSVKSISMLLLIVLSIFIAGCAESNLYIEVQPDQSSTLAFEAGISEVVGAAVINQFIDELRDSMSVYKAADGVNIQKWRENAYYWVRVEHSFQNLEELQAFFSNYQEFPGMVSIAKTTTLFRDEYTIRVMIEPLKYERASYEFFNPEDLIATNVFIKLPGQMSETNGIFDKNKQAYSWPMRSTESMRAYLKSTVFSWTQLLVVTLTCVVIVGGWLFSLKRPQLVSYFTRPVASTPRARPSESTTNQREVPTDNIAKPLHQQAQDQAHVATPFHQTNTPAVAPPIEQIEQGTFTSQSHTEPVTFTKQPRSTTRRVLIWGTLLAMSLILWIGFFTFVFPLVEVPQINWKNFSSSTAVPSPIVPSPNPTSIQTPIQREILIKEASVPTPMPQPSATTMSEIVQTSLFIAGNASLKIPEGEAGKVSIEIVGEWVGQHHVPVIVRNNTEKPITDINILVNVYSPNGTLLAVVASEELKPTIAYPGGVSLGYVELGTTLPSDSTLAN